MTWRSKKKAAPDGPGLKMRLRPEGFAFQKGTAATARLGGGSGRSFSLQNYGRPTQDNNAA